MSEAVTEQLKRSARELFDVEVEPVLSYPEPQFGDLATNVAMQLAKQVGKNPREVAEALAPKLEELDDVREVTVAGPGFLNVRLTDDALLGTWSLEAEKPYDGQKVVAEYSDPNPFKTLHAGHLYTTIVGNGISNLLEAGGATVVRVNFGGDVGLHVGKTMWAIKKELGEWDESKFSALLADADHTARFAWLSERYVTGNQAYEDDEQAKAEIVQLNKQVYQIHETDDRDTPMAKIYRTCRDWSYDYFKHFYETIGVTAFDRYLPESETAPLGLATVKEQQKAGVYQESDGAVVFKGEPYGLHTRVFINREGLPTYEAKDVGLLMTKWRDYTFDQSVIITGNDIAEYMKVVLKSVEQFEPEPARRTRHITHGQVRLAGGVKMSSRKGNVLGALDVIAAAETAATKDAEQGGYELHDSTVHGAFKYAFLKQRIGGDIVYDPEESVSLQGNSGPYLQYAHARACSILSKSSMKPVMSDDVALDEGERSLAVMLARYPDVLSGAVRDLAPHLVCTYLFELAQTFNRFYENSRVHGDPRETVRLTLVGNYRDTLAHGLGLLGMAAPEKL